MVVDFTLDARLGLIGCWEVNGTCFSLPNQPISARGALFPCVARINENRKILNLRPRHVVISWEKKIKLGRETNNTTSNILQTNISEKNIKISTQEYSLKFDNTTYNEQSSLVQMNCNLNFRNFSTEFPFKHLHW